MPKQQASPDLLALVAVVTIKHLPNVLNDLARHQGKPQGVSPTIPAEVLMRIMGVKRLAYRFKKGDHQADENERAGLTGLCDWLTDTAAWLAGNPVPTKATWSDPQFVGKAELPADAWDQMLEHVKTGKIG